MLAFSADADACFIVAFAAMIAVLFFVAHRFTRPRPAEPRGKMGNVVHFAPRKPRSPYAKYEHLREPPVVVSASDPPREGQ